MALTRLNNRSVSAITTLPSASTSSFLTAMPNGTVVQVKTAFSNTTQSYNGTSLTDVSGMSVDITPSSASNKIFVLVNITFGGSNDQYTKYRVLRNGTGIGLGPTGVGSAIQESFGFNTDDGHGTYDLYTAVWNYLDSPNTTSALTYKLQVRPMITTTSRTWYLNRPENTDDNNRTTGSSSITVMEIKA
jgi:hypothetical protein